MKIEDAKSYGGYQAVKGVAFLWIIAEFIFMLSETKGDFANGILFFLAAHMNLFFLFLLLSCFTTVYYLGRSAGYLIICHNKNYVHVGLRYGLLSAFLFIIYISGTVLFLNEMRSPGYNNKYGSTVLNGLLYTFIIMFIPILLAWLYAAKKIKAEGLVS